MIVTSRCVHLHTFTSLTRECWRGGVLALSGRSRPDAAGGWRHPFIIPCMVRGGLLIWDTTTNDHLYFTQHHLTSLVGGVRATYTPKRTKCRLACRGPNTGRWDANGCGCRLERGDVVEGLAEPSLSFSFPHLLTCDSSNLIGYFEYGRTVVHLYSEPRIRRRWARREGAAASW